MSDVLRTTAAYRARRIAHLCVWCGRPAALRPSGVAYAHCDTHRVIDNAKTDRNGRQAKLRHLADGRCYECGSFCARNPRAGASFNLCMQHRLRRSVRTNARRANNAPRRVLAALAGVMTMTEIRVAAKMDTRTCSRTMQELVLAGTVVGLRVSRRSSRPSKHAEILQVEAWRVEESQCVELRLEVVNDGLRRSDLRGVVVRDGHELPLEHFVGLELVASALEVVMRDQRSAFNGRIGRSLSHRGLTVSSGENGESSINRSKGVLGAVPGRPAPAVRS